jgi:SHS2 domain-containing protein
MTMARGHALLEHTADVGIRAWAPDVAGAFAEAAMGLVELMGARADAATGTRRLVGTGDDDGARLVSLLDEMVYLCESEDLGVTSVRIVGRSSGSVEVEVEVEAEVEVGPRRRDAEGLAVKAVTFHQLAVETTEAGTEVRVYVDV